MVSEDIEILEDMLTSLVDLLVEKGIITEEEYESKVKEHLEAFEELRRLEEWNFFIMF